MQDQAIRDLWKIYGQQLDESLYLNRENTAALTRMKVQSAIAGMQPVKIFALLTGILWVTFVDTVIVKSFAYANLFFLVSAGIQVVLTKVAIGIYLYQVILIRQVDADAPVLATQVQLARLRASTLWVARMLFLQLPVWTTFYWHKSMLVQGNAGLYLVQGIVTLSFLLAALWLFFNIRYKNRNKRWFRLIFNGKEWQPVIRSMELLRELESYKETP